MREGRESELRRLAATPEMEAIKVLLCIGAIDDPDVVPGFLFFKGMGDEVLVTEVSQFRRSHIGNLRNGS